MNKLTVYINDDYVKSDGTSTIYVYTHLKGKKVKFNTGVSVKSDTFDKTSGRIKGKSKQVKDNNLIIDNCKQRITDVFVRYRLQNIDLTPELLKQEYKIPSTYIDFYQFMALEIKQHSNENTKRLHESVLAKMKEYKKSLMFSEITADWLKEYKRYLKNKLKNNENTIHKNFGVIKAYLNIAIRKKIITSNPFEYYKISRVDANRVFLDEQELNHLIDIYKKQWLAPNLQKVLRHFLFSCFTGLRISDLKRIQHHDIVNNMLIFTPYKTKTKIVRVPLSKPALQLIKDENQHRIYGLIFKTYADQVINRHLKTIAELCGINKELSFHSARHTFATLFLKKTKNIAALQKLLGHTNIRETMTYAHILTEDLQKEMKVFDEFSF